MTEEDKPYADLTQIKEKSADSEKPIGQKSGKAPKRPAALSLAWNHDGTKLFAGLADNNIDVW